MGEEISHSSFSKQDFQEFERRLAEETQLLAQVDAAGALSAEGYVAGFEIEAWLLDHSYFPNPVNEGFLKALGHPLVVPELSRFNVELNCEPLPVSGDVLRRAENTLSRLWDHCNSVAHGMDTNMVMIGTLPVIRDDDLSLANLSPLERYRALNAEILRQRAGAPLVVDIAGDEHLRSEHRDVMLEAATTSFQVHLKTPAALAHRFYNASIMMTAPILAAAANAPFLFGKSLWHETRIPVFEQSIALTDRGGARGRVSFGAGYAEASLREALEENQAAFPVLLPILFSDPPARFRHVSLHNGTIWRWNRPLVGFDADATPHIRIEHRTLPAGPTIIDMIANAALYFGLARHAVDTGLDERGDLPFETARRNFYAAARDGLSARMDWPGAGTVTARDLLLDELIPAARQGLAAFGIDADDAGLFLGIVEARVRSGQTGAQWQRAALTRRGGDFLEMMAAYCKRQRSGAPVHQWDL